MSKSFEDLQVEGNVSVLFTTATENGMTVDELMAIIQNAESVTFRTGDEEVEVICCQTIVEEVRTYDEEDNESVIMKKVICPNGVKRTKIG